MTAQKRIRVMVVDDHPMVRDGLRHFISLSAGLEYVGQAQSGEEAVSLCEELKPDVILMDLMMPGIGGIEAIQRIRRQDPDVQLVALTSFADPKLVQQALKAGAVGYLLKNVGMNELTDAIRSAQARRRVLAPEATEALIQAMDMAQQDDLSERELEILKLVAEGLTNTEIANRLWIAEPTVRFHLGNIFSKLGARNRMEAVKLATARRLI
jgi:NarL family two-component system response regulator LiaR